MIFRIKVRVLAAASLVILPLAADAKLHRGFALIPPGPAWDFSDSTNVMPPAGDLGWIQLELVTGPTGVKPDSFIRDQASTLAMAGIWFQTYTPAMVGYAPGDSTYPELMTAPTDESAYSFGAAILSYGVYVVRTKEYNYAKVRIEQVGGGGITIEYTYQDNGTNVLVEPVAVLPTTWSRIKSLYR